jgi:NAD(P)-dependent dehydrogenase (short-subunit alcohol dehydrogenase family)
VLVNNAGNFNAGFFEELSAEEFRAQIETTLFGPGNVTRGGPSDHARPALRPDRHDLLDPAIEVGEFLAAYAASKFGGGGLDGVTVP